MYSDSQNFINGLIGQIHDEEKEGKVTNQMVAAVLDFLNRGFLHLRSIASPDDDDCWCPAQLELKELRKHFNYYSANEVDPDSLCTPGFYVLTGDESKCLIVQAMLFNLGAGINRFVCVQYLFQGGDVRVRGGKANNVNLQEQPITLEWSEWESFTKKLETEITHISEIATTASTTADAAKTTADNAEGQALAAKSLALSANDSASRAKTTADNAEGQALAAKSLALSANDSASRAKTTADNAASTASSAKTTADEAKKIAEDAQTTAATAKTAVGDANERIDEVQRTMNNLAGRIEVLNIYPCDGFWNGEEPQPNTGVYLCPNGDGGVYFCSFGETDYYGIAEEEYNNDIYANTENIYIIGTGLYRIINNNFEALTRNIDNELREIRILTNDAKATATAAKTAADNASKTAATAKSTAEGAQTTAAAASSTATAAKTAADNASSTATAAKSTTEGAQTTAAAASSTATAAKTAADNASKTAATAKSTAEGAQTTAENAITLANAIAKIANTAKDSAEKADKCNTILCCSIDGGKLYLHGHIVYKSMGLYPYLFRFTRKVNRYRTRNGYKRSKVRKGWNVFGSIYSLVVDPDGLVNFSTRPHDRIDKDYAPQYYPEPELLGVPLKRGQIGWGKSSIRLSRDNKYRTLRFKWGIAYGEWNAGTSNRNLLTTMHSNLAEFSIVFKVNPNTPICWFFSK